MLLYEVNLRSEGLCREQFEKVEMGAYAGFSGVKFDLSAIVDNKEMYGRGALRVGDLGWAVWAVMQRECRNFKTEERALPHFFELDLEFFTARVL